MSAGIVITPAGATRLFEGAQDAIEAFKVLRMEIANIPQAVEVCDAHIDLLEYAIINAESAK